MYILFGETDTSKITIRRVGNYLKVPFRIHKNSKVYVLTIDVFRNHSATVSEHLADRGRTVPYRDRVYLRPKVHSVLFQLRKQILETSDDWYTFCGHKWDFTFEPGFLDFGENSDAT